MNRKINPVPTPPPTDAELAARWAAEALAEGRYELGAALANIARNAARAEYAAAHGARMVPMIGRTRDEVAHSDPTALARHVDNARTPIHDEVTTRGPIRLVDVGPLCPHGFVADGQACGEFGCFDEQGARFRDAQTEVVAMGPTGNGNRDVPELASEAQTELFGAVRETDLETPPHGRCVALIETHGPGGERNRLECHEVIIWDHGHVGDASTPAVRAGWRHLDPAFDQHHNPVPQA